MTVFLKILLRVVRRRLADGEKLESIFADYPRLTQQEQAAIRAEIKE